MTFSVNFNGIELADIVDGFTSINRNISSTWTNNFSPSGGSSQATRYGQDFLFNTLGPKTITVTFIKNGVPKDWVDIRNKIAQILDVTEPCPLIFGDEPNKIWYALPDQLPTLTEDLPTLTATGTITFVVPSGTGVSSYTQTLNGDNSGGENGNIVINSDNSVTININNQGILPTYPMIKVKNTEENGFISIVSENGIVEIGDVAEVDGIGGTKSELLLDAVNNEASDFSGFVPSSLTHSVGNPDRPNNGEISYQTDGLRLTNTGSGTGWHVGILTFELPLDSAGIKGALSFINDFNIVFETGTIKEMGYIHVLACDDNDNPIIGYGISKTNQNNNDGEVNFYYQDVDNLGNMVANVNRQTFQANGVKQSLNPVFYHTNGHVEMTKQEGKLSWVYNGKRYNSNIPELAETNITRLNIEIGAYGTAPKINNLSLRRIWLQKTNVVGDADIPNRFIANSEIDVDMEAGKIMLDTLPAMDQMVDGSTFFSIPPGTSQIVITPSSWATSPPQIEIDWEERYS